MKALKEIQRVAIMSVREIARGSKQVMRNNICTLLTATITATFIYLSWSHLYSENPRLMQTITNATHVDIKGT